MFGVKNEFNRVNAHPWSFVVKRTQFLELGFVSVKDFTDDTVQIGLDGVLKRSEVNLWFMNLVNPTFEFKLLSANSDNSDLNTLVVF